MKGKHRTKLDWAGALDQEVSAVVVNWFQQQEKRIQTAWKHYRKARNEDPEALHDLRVEVRRIRVWLRVAKDLVDTRRKGRQTLRELAHSSNPVRDHEVMVGLLQQCHAHAALQDTASLLLQRYEIEGCALQSVSFDPKDAALKPKPLVETGLSFGNWLAEQLVKIHAQIESDLDKGELRLHEARIQIKYLRYLIEPLASETVAADLLVELKRLQTHLGDIHDLSVFRLHLPTYAQWLIDEEVAPWLVDHIGKQARPLLRGFGRVSDGILGLASWQTEQMQKELSAWRGDESGIRQQLAQQMSALVEYLRRDGAEVERLD